MPMGKIFIYLYFFFNDSAISIADCLFLGIKHFAGGLIQKAFKDKGIEVEVERKNSDPNSN
jgi:hypothetical protein